MMSSQRRRERENRQNNERLKTRISAYKTLGGSFTGELGVDPTHLVTGRKVGTARLVVSLRDFIRRALDLEPIPQGLVIPDQGPLRPSGGGGGTGGGRGGGGAGGAGAGGAGMGEAGIQVDTDDNRA